MLFAQITDTHIKRPGHFAYGRVDTAATLAACVAHLAARTTRPDLVVVTGDLVDGGDPEEYAHLRRLLAPLPMPVYVIPGNHDEREALRRAFGGDGYLPARGFLNYVLEEGEVRIVALDTNIPGAPGGRLCDERLAWLDSVLAAAPERPTVVMMHHPPFPSGIAYMDAMALEEPERLAEVIRRHPQVERILCGHLHRAAVARFAGTVAAAAPSTGHQLALELEPQPRGGYVMQPPTVTLHLWRHGQLVSHSEPVGDFGGFQPFSRG